MGDRVTVLFIAAWTLVTALLVYSVPARAQNELYDTSQTMTIEGDVAGFVVGDEYATVSMFPVGEPKNSRTMWVVDWRGGTSLSGQGITADWLKSGDRVVVTGHPYRIAGRRQMLLETITRGSDGRKWARGQAASTSSASQGSDAGGSPGAQHGEESHPGGGSSGAGNTPASVAAPSPQADAGAQAATSAPAQPATTAASDSEAVASTAGNAQASSSTALATPAAEVRPPTTTTPSAQATPEQTETLAERQKAINEDVSAKTASVVADLKKKADTQLAQAGAATQAAAPAAAQSQAAQTQSAGAPAGPAWEPCKGELRSGASQTAVPVEFVNSSKQPRKLIWFDFAGAKIVAGTLQPGQRAPMQTYMTHAWMIADGSDRCMGTLVISKAGSIEIR